MEPQAIVQEPNSPNLQRLHDGIEKALKHREYVNGLKAEIEALKKELTAGKAVMAEIARRFQGSLSVIQAQELKISEIAELQVKISELQAELSNKEVVNTDSIKTIIELQERIETLTAENLELRAVSYDKVPGSDSDSTPMVRLVKPTLNNPGNPFDSVETLFASPSAPNLGRKCEETTTPEIKRSQSVPNLHDFSLVSALQNTIKERCTGNFRPQITYEELLRAINKKVAENKNVLNPSGLYRGIGAKIEISNDGIKITKLYSPELNRFKVDEKGYLKNPQALEGRVITAVILPGQNEQTSLIGMDAEKVAELFHDSGDIRLVFDNGEIVTCERAEQKSVFLGSEQEVYNPKEHGITKYLPELARDKQVPKTPRTPRVDKNGDLGEILRVTPVPNFFGNAASAAAAG